MTSQSSISPLSDIAQQICEKRYFIKDSDGKVIENWEQLSWRVINAVCPNESDEYKQRMQQRIFNTQFLPNSPCLVNAGRNTKSNGKLACFVVPSTDDLWSSGNQKNKTGMVETIGNFGHVARQGGGAVPADVSKRINQLIKDLQREHAKEGLSQKTVK